MWLYMHVIESVYLLECVLFMQIHMPFFFFSKTDIIKNAVILKKKSTDIGSIKECKCVKCVVEEG